MNNITIPAGSDLKSRGERLRYLRQDVMNLTIIEFSRFCQLGDSTIRQYEKGRVSGLTDRAITTIIERLNPFAYCSFEWLASGTGDLPVLKQAATDQLSPNQLIQREQELIQHEIERFQRDADNAIVFHVEDDAMEPLYLVGDSVAGNRYMGDAIKQCVGDVCIVQTRTNQLVVRKLQYGSKAGLYCLYNTNPATTVKHPGYIDIEIMCAAPIVRVWRLPTFLLRNKQLL